ncbi:hypothetical protein [Streptomyces sp. NPDC048577]|uniref:hypothetical protein n=1 Tax=Streptomyces sp. NPDC048577 TaxID=3157209 RepID=UPI00342881B9
MIRGRAVAAAVGLVLVTAGLGGCGVRRTDVIEAGAPATIGVDTPPPDRMLLFFVDAHGGLMPVARRLDAPLPDESSPGDTSGDTGGRSPVPGTSGGSGAASDRRGRVATEKVLTVLQYGPDSRERAVGITSRLSPPRAEAPEFTVEVPASGDRADGERTVLVRTQRRVLDLDETAVEQLVCTTAYAEDPRGGTLVRLVGVDGSLPAAACD